MLKLDFKKAYDTINLKFLFLSMFKLGIPQAFVDVAKILFVEAEVSLQVHGAKPSSLPIEQGVRQGCPLVPYLFLFVGQALNYYTKYQQSQGSIQDFDLSNGQGQQLMVQYADDTSFMLAGNENNLESITNILHQFHLASSLETNWCKSYGYLFLPNAKSPWLFSFPDLWAAPGTPFFLLTQVK